MTADITRLDGIATLTLRTSHAMNSCSMTDFGALRDRFIELGADPEVHAVILTGSGRAFCVGAALDTFLGEAGLSGAPERLREGFDTCLNPLLRAMVDLPKPLVIAINGTVAGGGMGLALLGDLMSGKVNQGLANSALYLKVFGHTVIGWRWLEQAIRAEAGLARTDNAEEQAFYRGKLQAARYYVTWELPEIYGQTTVLRRLDTTTLDMQESWF
mgnify:CR=1 FL=1